MGKMKIVQDKGWSRKSPPHLPRRGPRGEKQQTSHHLALATPVAAAVTNLRLFLDEPSFDDRKLDPLGSITKAIASLKEHVWLRIGIFARSDGRLVVFY